MYVRHRSAAWKPGFTLIELIVVMVILGLLAALVVPKYTKRQEQAKRGATITQIGFIRDALELYHQDNGRYPTTAQGLQALLTEPTAAPKPRKWDGPYLQGTQEVPTDGWGGEFQYESPGSHSEDYDIISLGRDAQEGGEGLDEDIYSWNLPRE